MSDHDKIADLTLALESALQECRRLRCDLMVVKGVVMSVMKQFPADQRAAMIEEAVKLEQMLWEKLEDQAPSYAAWADLRKPEDLE